MRGWNATLKLDTGFLSGLDFASIIPKVIDGSLCNAGKAPPPALLSAFVLQVLIPLQNSHNPSLDHGAESIYPRLSFSVTYPPSERTQFLVIDVHVAILEGLPPYASGCFQKF